MTVGPSCRTRLWYFLSPLDGPSVREAHCAQASTAVLFSARSALRAGYWPTCLTDGHMVVNDHTRSVENWKCVWYLERGSSAVECRTRNQVSPGSNLPLLPFGRLGIFVLSIDALVDSAV